MVFFLLFFIFNQEMSCCNGSEKGSYFKSAIEVQQITEFQFSGPGDLPSM